MERSLLIPPDARASATHTHRSARRIDPVTAIVVAGAIAGIVLAILSDGSLWQDEYAHLQFSRWVTEHPQVAVDLWGRPLATLLYVFPAWFGLTAARLMTVALAACAALWTARAARTRGASGSVTAAATLAQPVFFSFSFGALPGTLFAALLARFFYDDASGRHTSAAVVAALLPLARVEGVLVVLVYAIALWRRGARRHALIPFTGLAAWNLAGFAVTGSLFFLLTANPYPAIGSIYPTAGVLYLERVLPLAVGVPVFVLAQAGAASTIRRARVEHALALVAAVFLTLVWGVPMFASTPTPVYLIGFAPLLALFAAEGWRAIAARPRWLAWFGALVLAEGIIFVPHRVLGFLARTTATPVAGRERLALAAGFALIGIALVAAARIARARHGIGVALVVAAVSHLAITVGPVPVSPHERVAAEAAAWYRANGDARPVVAVAPDLMWFARLDPFGDDWEPGTLPADADALSSLSDDHLVAWDSEFSPREGGTSLDALLARGWRPVASFTAGDAEIRFLARA